MVEVVFTFDDTLFYCISIMKFDYEIDIECSTFLFHYYLKSSGCIRITNQLPTNKISHKPNRTSTFSTYNSI